MLRKLSQKLLVIAAIAALGMLATTCAAQVVNDAYQLSYFNTGLVVNVDTSIRIINTGQVGSPIDAASAHGRVCADIYVFDTNQEMLECCSCPITANGLLTLSVQQNLVQSTLTNVRLISGVVKIVSDRGCDPTAITAPVPGGLRAFSPHEQEIITPIPGDGQLFTFQGITETEFQSAPLQSQEAAFLGNACSFVLYLGSGRGKCACPAAS